MLEATVSAEKIVWQNDENRILSRLPDPGLVIGQTQNRSKQERVALGWNNAAQFSISAAGREPLEPVFWIFQWAFIMYYWSVVVYQRNTDSAGNFALSLCIPSSAHPALLQQANTEK